MRWEPGQSLASAGCSLTRNPRPNPKARESWPRDRPVPGEILFSPRLFHDTPLATSLACSPTPHELLVPG